MAIQILIHQICRCEYESVQVAIPFSNSNKYVFYSLLTIPQSFSSASSSLSVGSTKNSNSLKSKRLPCSKNTSEDCGNHHASSKISHSTRPTLASSRQIIESLRALWLARARAPAPQRVPPVQRLRPLPVWPPRVPRRWKHHVHGPRGP